MFIALPSLSVVSSDEKVLNKINKYRDLIEALPAGVITVGSFIHSHLCGRPKLPFVLPVRELLKSMYFKIKGSVSCLDNLNDTHISL